jgi:DNA invertase Pin-like site-specific DNA recombinase
MKPIDRPAEKPGESEPAAAVSAPARHHYWSRPTKVQACHLDRLAVVYVRQSSAFQVAHNKESTEIQRGLRERAIEWGWPRKRVLVIEDDQAHSGSTATERSGFQWIWSEVTLNHIGIILGIEMDRLARSCKDWYDLMERCALYNTLLSDFDGVYDPTVFNDRLLLGLKAIMGEAELHLIRQRLYQGRMNKARRGELFTTAPLGYVRRGDNAIELDPDPQVQSVLRLLFDKFQELGSACGVMRYLANNQIRLGFRIQHGLDAGRLRWQPASRGVVLKVLRHPIYAGCYVYGLTQMDPRRRTARRRLPARVQVARLQWEVLIPNRLPAYITWEQYLANQARLEANRSRRSAPGAPRSGPSLLSGLVFCGRCQRRMAVWYATGRGPAYYLCAWDAAERAGPRCQSLTGRPLEEMITALVLEVMKPAKLELSLAAINDLEAERKRLHKLWQQRLERARYETRRAERQHEMIDPENRLVARELEQRWERLLLEQHKLEEEYDRFVHELPPEVTEAERRSLLKLSSDLPGIWHATTTTVQDRQEIVRLLIERVIVACRGRTELVDVTVRWAGGMETQHLLRRPVMGYEQLSDYASLRDRVLELRGHGHTTAQIAERLNQQGYRPPRGGESFSSHMVIEFLRRQGFSGPSSGPKLDNSSLGQHEWGVKALAEHLDMSAITLYHWCRKGWVHHRKLPGVKGCVIIWADAGERRRLRRLYAFRPTNSPPPYPAELTTPGPRPVARTTGKRAPQKQNSR